MLWTAVTLLLLVCAVTRYSLVVPFEYGNHRLTYRPFPHFINSAAEDNTRILDYVLLEEQLTTLPAHDKMMCKKKNEKGKIIPISCPVKGAHTKEKVIWRISDVFTRVVMLKDENDNCMTASRSDSAADILDMTIQPCIEGNPRQLFFLNVDHGDRTSPDINAETLDLRTTKEFTNYLKARGLGSR